VSPLRAAGSAGAVAIRWNWVSVASLARTFLASPARKSAIATLVYSASVKRTSRAETLIIFSAGGSPVQPAVV
jgi:hypothetical protein